MLSKFCTFWCILFLFHFLLNLMLSLLNYNCNLTATSTLIRLTGVSMLGFKINLKFYFEHELVERTLH